MTPILAEFDKTTQWLLVIAGVLTILYALFRGSLKRKKDPLDKPGPRFSLSQQRAVERDVNGLLVEMLEMARQITAQLDTRSTRLQLLIEEADRKMAQLKAMLPPSVAGVADPGPRVGQASSLSADETGGTPVLRLPPASPSPAAEEPRSAAEPPERDEPMRVPAVERQISQMHREVYDLADTGRSAHAIAQELGRPVGEIELILALRR